MHCSPFYFNFLGSSREPLAFLHFQWVSTVGLSFIFSTAAIKLTSFRGMQYITHKCSYMVACVAFSVCMCVHRSQLSEHKARRSTQLRTPILYKPYVALYLAFSGDLYFLSKQFFHRCPCNTTGVLGDNIVEDSDGRGGVTVR